MSEYTPTIGLEIHAELKTETKMFCNSRNDPHHAESNEHVCPVCMGHPGTLPTINKEAVKQVLMVGVALSGELAKFTEFDRKNYFYPDIPKGYQISQYKYPLVHGGTLAGIAITRVHLEEDTARSLHDQGGGSLIDYNRAGVPLLELVTEPEIHDARTAGDFARELQLLLRTLGVSDAQMEQGEMRVEANISVSPDRTLGTKVEVKNLNSFRSVEAAIEYEIKRHIACIENGKKVTQETRGWDENKNRTLSQRTKETSEDYRYFPDPDLPKLSTQEMQEFEETRLNETLPVMPYEKRVEYANLGITSNIINVIISNIEIDSFFRGVIDRIDKSDKRTIKNAANYLTSDVVGYITEHPEATIAQADIESFTSLMKLLTGNQITSRVAKDLLAEVLFEGIDPHTLAKKRGLLQESSEGSLLPVVEKIITDNPMVVKEYREGKEPAIQFLIGQGMKITKGSANPTLLKELLEKKID